MADAGDLCQVQGYTSSMQQHPVRIKLTAGSDTTACAVRALHYPVQTAAMVRLGHTCSSLASPPPAPTAQTAPPQHQAAAAGLSGT
jgi:hypothetical protein